MNPELEGEDLFGEMQSTPLPRNNPSDNEEEEQDSVAVINPVASATVANVWKPKSPIMGGIIQIGKDDYMPHTGGKPNAQWTGLEASGTRISVLQYRPIGSSSIKGYSARTKGLRTKFNKDGELESFVTDVMEHMKQTGMDTISYLHDPADKDKSIDKKEMTTVIEHHGRFTLDYTKEASKVIKLKWDGYDEQNDADAVLFLLNSLNNTFKKGI